MDPRDLEGLLGGFRPRGAGAAYRVAHHGDPYGRGSDRDPAGPDRCRDGSDGPRAAFRLRNDGSPATIEVTTVLYIEGGGSYEASTVVDIAAGSEVVLEYPVVRWDRLTEPERETVERRGFDFDVYLNGEPRNVG